MDPEQTSPSVFISYASPDRERAFEICRYLEDMGHRCWIAPRNIRAGHDYGEEIIRGIERARCFVLVFSSAANKSIYVKRELERAVSKAKPVFPVRLEDVLPAASLELHLASLHYLDAWNGVLRDHISALARTLSGEGNAGPFPPAPAHPPWWRGRSAVAAAATGVVALGAVAWWWRAPPPVVAAPQPAVEAGADAPATTPLQRVAVQGAALRSCRIDSSGPSLVRCTGAPVGSRVHVRDVHGGETVIPGGSGADSYSSGGSRSRSTYLPWVGPGSSARVEAEGGVMWREQPLPPAPDTAAAVRVPSRDAQAPPLFYAWGGREWAYTFFAPFDTTDVDWSFDGAAPVRTTRRPTAGGPFSQDSDSDDTSRLSIRWRNAAGEWSEPAEYQPDVPEARVTSVKPLQDLVGAIGCHRVTAHPLPTHIRCASTSSVPLGFLFEDLRWGTGPGDLQPVEGFDFKAWALASVASSSDVPTTRPGDASGCGSDAACLHRVRGAAQQALNQQLRDRGLHEARVDFDASLFTPWKMAERTGSAPFIAMLPVDGDLYFQAMPRGGGEPLSARVNVADRRP